jgi:plasmid stabilization system protein ParE
VRVDLSPEARLDLRSIGDFIAEENLPRSYSFVAELGDKARGLGDFPERFPLVERYAHLGIRRRKHGSYLILYRIDPDRVFVLRFIHGARDYEALLFPDA